MCTHVVAPSSDVFVQRATLPPMIETAPRTRRLDSAPRTRTPFHTSHAMDQAHLNNRSAGSFGR